MCKPSLIHKTTTTTATRWGEHVPLPRAVSSLCDSRASEKSQTETKVNVFFVFFGKTHCLHLNPDISVESLKTEFAQHLQSTGYGRFRASDLCMVGKGKPLDDQDPLVSPHTLCITGCHRDVITLHVWVRKPGGCFMISAFVLFLILTAIVGSICTCGCSLLVIPFLLPLLFILPLFCL